MASPTDFNCADGCPVEAALEMFGGKWKGVILFHLLEKTKRFSELQREMGAVTPRILTKQLRELESSGLVNRKVYPVVPPKVEYSLTSKGMTLEPILKSLQTWGQTHIQAD